MMAQHVQCEYKGLVAVHRYEDLAVIAEAIRAVKPPAAVELGTAGGGFAAFLSDLLAEWGVRELGYLVTFDKHLDVGVAARLHTEFMVAAIQADVLTAADATIVRGVQAGAMLYCDNGNKQRELELYAPHAALGGLVGTHDYGTEVDPAWAEPFMTSLGFRPHWHEAFEALAHPEHYPVSLTRFWRRVEKRDA